MSLIKLYRYYIYMNKGIISPKPTKRKSPLFSLQNIIYQHQPKGTFNFNSSMLNLPKKKFTRPPRYRIKNRTWKTPISSIPEGDENSTGGKKRKKKKYTRRRKSLK